MKLIIQIPCYNEEETLPVTLKELPRELPGIDTIEWLLINDGSTDKSIEIARQDGVDHIVDLKNHRGLAKAFILGLDACIKADADIIINFDADNQYNAEDIPVLIKPILEGNAEIVIGARPIDHIKHFSYMKKVLQKFGSWIVRLISNTKISDCTSGFRAISKNAAMHLTVFNNYTYTLEMIIQAGLKNIPIVSIPIRTNEMLRESRLIKSIPSYIIKSIITIFRIFLIYRPALFFFYFGFISFIPGFGLCIRWLIFFLGGSMKPRTPSLILAAILILISIQMWIFGFIADLMSANRNLLEETRFRIRQLEVDSMKKNK